MDSFHAALTEGAEPGNERFSVEHILKVLKCAGVEVRRTWSRCAAVALRI